MNLVAAVDKNWAIGNKNKLLAQIPADQKFFRETTIGKVVVMGRKTLESFPNGLPLKNRINVVLTHNRDFAAPNVIIVHSMEELRDELKRHNSCDIYIIGGETIYSQLLDECDVAYITKINHVFEADTHLPNLDKKTDWKIMTKTQEEIYSDLEYCFCKYVREVKDIAKE